MPSVAREALSMNNVQADAVMQAAEAEAARRGLNVTIVVVDSGGHLLAARRWDGAPCGTVTVAIAKASCAASFRRTTRSFAERVMAGESGVVTLPGVVAVAGGVPILIDGTLLGAVGVSGARPDEDESIALVGISAISA